ncbi:GNAT family N-acetyltransferase [Agrobacterium salinitolerans]|uniref:GNAT family N-acetyltransferase n=1 Tax=Agrobacterium salinitolerans TaxID=1183413 RepID=UPI00345E2412
MPLMGRNPTRRLRRDKNVVAEGMPNVKLSRAVQADADALIDSNRKSAAYHLPWVKPFIDHEGFDAWYGRILTGPNLGYIVREAEADTIIGVVNFSEIVWGMFRSAYLSYYGMVDWSRKGLMTEGVRCACRHAFDDLGLHRLEANIQPENVASLALIKRVGFRKEGFSTRYLKISGSWRDHERWALLADR